MLEVRDLHAYYGKSHILQGVTLDVGAGEIVSLLGRNGVGRSTTIKAIMGEVPPTGSIKFKGEEIAGAKAHEIAHKGLGYVPEHRAIFPTLTVRQNLILGQLTICRTLMGDPDLIMSDEPTEGLAPQLVERVAELLQEIAGRGVSVLLIEQKLTIALRVSNRIFVMGHGKIVFEGTPEDLRGRAEIRREWLEV